MIMSVPKLKFLNYDLSGPEFWSEIAANCGGKSQSPINIDTSLAKPIKLPKFQFSALSVFWGALLCKVSIFICQEFYQ